MPKITLIEVRGAFRHVMQLQERERKALLSEIVQIKGLMPLLMKPRNDQRWSAEDKAELREHMRRISHISPYIAIMILPGSIVMLPVLAWWLDRRRNGAPEQRAKREREAQNLANASAAANATQEAGAQAAAQSPIQTD
jgi:hypothetical protein